MPQNGPNGNSDARANDDGTSSLLVEGFKRGDPDTVAEVRRRVARIIAFGRYRIPLDDQDGLQQEVLVQIWQAINRDGFDRDRGFWGFVQTVAARRCIDWIRKYTPAIVEDAPVADSRRSPLARVLDRERQAELSKAIEELAPACKDLITLRIEKGKSYGEIAQLQGRSAQALRAQMYRCIRKLRDLVGGDGDDHAT